MFTSVFYRFRFRAPSRRPGWGRTKAGRGLSLEKLEDRALLANFTVNVDSIAGNGAADAMCDIDRQAPGDQCSFNAALYAASVTPDADTISFAVPALNLGSNSPNLGGQITIDGLLAGGDKVQFNGDLRLFDDLTVRNLRVVGSVIFFSGSNGAMVNDNEIAGQILFNQDAADTHIVNNRVNGTGGIYSIYATNNLEIKGNWVTGGGSIALKAGAGNFIENNVVLGSSDSFVGQGHGITLGINTTANIIRGNSVGVDPLTNQIVPIEHNGLDIYGNGHTIVANTVAGSRVGIFLSGDRSGGHQVQENRIGTDQTGTLNLGNETFGIFISGGGNTVGGPTAADGNIIAFNGSGGVVVFGFAGSSQASGNRIQGNRIFDNGGPGINLGDDSNDVGDADVGPNQLQNHPVVTQSCDGDILLTLDSTPRKQFVIDFYSNPAIGPTGNEGHVYLGAGTVTTDDNGHVSIASPFRPHDGEILSATASDEFGNTSEFSRLESRSPVIFLPGIGGTFSTPEAHGDWIVNRGVAPETLQIDPIGLTYTDLLKTLANAGYQEGRDLVTMNYDWRLPPAPDDGIADGRITGLTAADISRPRVGGEFRHGVDYLGGTLRKLVDGWSSNCPGLPLESVDVIAHSTGGLVTRAYIQSDAYNGIYEGNKRLPSINRFVMLDVPNQGASKPWNPLHDDWGYDTSYRFLSNFAEAAYRKLANGQTIRGPDYDIQRGTGPDEGRIRFVDVTIEDGEPTRDLDTTSRFIQLYIPTLRTLLASYDFIDNGDGTQSNVNLTADRNWLALDLNGGADVNAFAERVGQAIAVYGDGETTPTTVTRQTCSGLVCPDRYSILDSYFDNDRVEGEVYWTDNTTTEGDETVPLVSLVGQFQNDARVIKSRWDKGENTNDSVSHSEIVMNRDVQRAILEFLGKDPSNVVVSYGSQRGATGLNDGYALIVDPVEAIVTDANGNRLGYSSETGVLAEIPNSVYLGAADGIGFVFGPVALPLRLRLTGLGESYFVELSGGQGGRIVEFEASGDLASGATRSHDIQLSSPASWQNPINPADVNGDGQVAPLDALLVINELTARIFSDPESGQLDPIDVPPTTFLDVNGDGFLAPLDALLVINQLPSTAPRASGSASRGDAVPEPEISGNLLQGRASSTRNRFSRRLGAVPAWLDRFPAPLVT